MTLQSLSPTTMALASCLAVVEAEVKEREEQNQSPWAHSPFTWLLHLAPAKKNAAAKRMLQIWLEQRGHTFNRSRQSGIDGLLNGVPILFRFSVQWDAGWLAFQQIRDTPFQRALLLGLTPQEPMIWLVPRSVMEQHVLGKMPQHGASTDWLRLYPDEVPDWLQPFGSDLATFERLLPLNERRAAA